MIPIISIIVAAVCLALFIVKDGKCLSLKEEVDSLKKQLAGASEPSVNEDDRPLDKEAAMDAIRYNGFVPDTDGNWEAQKAEIERSIVRVMDILAYLPVNSLEREICELRHIDMKSWRQISEQIPMSRY